eukprot:6326777-Karenia_brevis.AAC.1
MSVRRATLIRRMIAKHRKLEGKIKQLIKRYRREWRRAKEAGELRRFTPLGPVGHFFEDLQEI